MKTQVPLQLAPRPRKILPSGERSAPAFWIRSVLLLRELQSGPEFVVRRIDLRRGLNILWARPAEEHDVKVFDGSLRGHTAGKSTFCRMLRFLLGEGSFGTSDARGRIRKAFPHGWVVGEIEIDSQTWCVGRAFSPGAHPFCGLGTADEIIERKEDRRPYQDFVSMLGRAVLTPLGITRLGATDRELEWGHVLPWLTRDQEARFGGAQDWRDKLSESEAPETLVAERNAIIRAILAVTSEAEQDAARKHEALIQEKRQATDRRPVLAHQADTDRRRLLERLPGLLGEPPLLWTAAENHLKTRRAEIEETPSPDDTELLALHERSIQTATTTRIYRLEREKVAALLGGALSAQQQLQRDEAGEEDRKVLAALSLNAQVCNVPISVARTRGCPLTPQVSDLTSVRRDRATEGALNLQAEQVSSLQESYRKLDELLRQSEVETRKVQTDYLRANTLRSEWASRRARARADCESLERDLRLAIETRAAADALTDRLTALEKDLEDSLARQVQLRKRHAAALGRVSDCFDLVVQGLLGTTSHGEVRESGDSLTLAIEERGDRTSTSLTIVKVLAFDLAAVTASVEGQGTFPRFLVHDGPREADLDPSVYARLFLYARALEEACVGEPSFQYIVTTTTAPPEELRRAPWLMDPVLDASTAAGRLLGVDL